MEATGAEGRVAHDHGIPSGAGWGYSESQGTLGSSVLGPQVGMFPVGGCSAQEG
jgi:hypothetical protein